MINIDHVQQFNSRCNVQFNSIQLYLKCKITMEHDLETLYKSSHHTTVQFKKEEKDKNMQTQYELKLERKLIK